jgi:uncharacterized membrane protein
MNSRILAALVIVLLVVLAVVQLTVYLPKVPAEVATRYDSSGQPAMTISKARLVATYVGVLVFCLIYAAVAFFSVRRLPERYFKVLPNHEHWLAPGREADTVNTISAYLLWLGAATLILFMSFFQFIFISSTGGYSGSLDVATNLLTTLYLTFIFFGVIRLRARFKVKNRASGS